MQRPGAPERIEADLGLLYQAARIVKERVRALDFVDVREVVDEFARAIRQELDYRLEGRNAEQLHRNFAGHPHVRVPRVYWSYTRSRVLTLEFIEGTQLADIDEVGYSLEERKRLAEVIAEAWMTMIFRDGFFHGDPHPANILVIRPDLIGLVDFGLAGKLTEDDVSKATRLFIDVANENVERSAEATRRPRRPLSQGSRGGVPHRDQRLLLPLLRRAAGGDRPAAGDPRGLRPHLLAQPAAPDALHHPRQGGRDPRIGRHRALPGLQRLRGREAVRAEPSDEPPHAAAHGHAGPPRDSQARVGLR